MSTKHHLRPSVVAAALILAGCGRARPATQAPAPEPAAPAAAAGRPATTPAPAPGVAADTSARPDSAPAPAADSIRTSDITRQAVGVFGDSILADSSAMAEGDAEGPTWDIDVRSYETHARVEHYVRAFSGPARDRIQSRLEYGSRYEPMIRAKFRAAGVPEDMYYLALIESGYNNDAYSSAAAVGMWQFMTATAKGVGLRVDWWVDERRDPVRATDGAIRFLGWLREQLGSYYLAAAAYNGGPGRVARGLTRYAADLEGTTGDDAAFALMDKDYLPRETRNYVPQLIAAALVGKDPSRYGLTLRTRPPFVYDSVRVEPGTPMAVVARAAMVPLDQVTELNPHVLRGLTPPTGPALWVRIPVWSAAAFDSLMRAVDPADRVAFRRVSTTKGQTLASVARKHGLTERQLAWYNRKVERTKKGVLYVGQTLLIPSADVLRGARDVPDPSIEKYGSAKSSRRLHVVRKGESLGLIARKYGTTVKAIQRLNGMKKTMVFPGQTLVVKGSPRSAKATARSSSARSRSSSSAKAKKPAASRSPSLSTRRPAAKAKSTTSARKPAAKKPPARKPAARKPAGR